MKNFVVPFIIGPTKSREEKIEEARKSGLIGSHGDKDFVGAKYGQEIVCRNCGSRDIQVGIPHQRDEETGVQIPYTCKRCGYEGMRVARVKNMGADGVLDVDLIPDSLIGVEGYGSFLGGQY